MKFISNFKDYIFEHSNINTDDFKVWFKGSKIVDNNGEPLICYHRSKAKFNIFDDKYITKNGWVGDGFYFSDNKDSFKEYGRNVYKAYLNIKNPYISSADSWFDFLSEVGKNFNNGVIDDYNLTQLLIDNGFDGVIYTHWDKGVIINCFYSNQIKIIK